MKYKFFAGLLSLVIVFAFAGCGNGSTFEALSKSLNIYEIEAVLNYGEKTLEAVENLSYNNQTGADLSELKFHLYPNAFREGVQEYKAVSEAQSAKAYPNGFSEGGINIESTKVNGKTVNYDIEGEDKNILSVPFGFVLKNGGLVEVEIVFNLIIPNAEHRFGYGESTLNLGNWYPIVCVFEESGFVVDGYSPNGDPFYSDVANYHIDIAYDSNLKLASTGEVCKEELEGNFIKSCIEAKVVRDFAMVFSESFEVVKTTAGKVDIEYYYFDDENAEENLQVAVDAMNTFNRLIGEYPYSKLNVVKADFFQGGMEYPMLVYISSDVDVESDYKNVIVHEIAHQWWYGVVGNNECEYAWIDEGLAEYVTALFYDFNPKYGKNSEEVFGSALSSYLLFCDVYGEIYDTFDSSMNRSIYNFHNETEYVYLTYVKSVLMFDSIAEIIGQNRMEKVLQAFYEKNSFKNVKPIDLIEAIEEVSHRKIASFVMSWLDGSVILEELNG